MFKSLKSIVLLLALILILLIGSAAEVRAESGGWFPFRADICQTQAAYVEAGAVGLYESS